MAFVDFLRKRRDAYLTEQQQAARQAQTAWIGCLVVFRSATIAQWYPWLVLDGVDLVCGEVVGVNEQGHVSVLYGYDQQDRPLHLVGRVEELGERFQRVGEGQ